MSPLDHAAAAPDDEARNPRAGLTKAERAEEDRAYGVRVREAADLTGPLCASIRSLELMAIGLDRLNMVDPIDMAGLRGAIDHAAEIAERVSAFVEDREPVV